MADDSAATTGDLKLLKQELQGDMKLLKEEIFRYFDLKQEETIRYIDLKQEENIRYIDLKQEETHRHFDLSVETIRHDLLGANHDEIEVLKDARKNHDKRIVVLEEHAGIRR